MEKITWLDVIKISIPVLAVILAGVFALFNLRHSIRLQARNKWKEDFRLHVSDYLETYMNTLFNTTKMKAEMIGGCNFDTATKLSLSMSQLTGRITKIEMMLDKNSKDYNDLDSLAQYNNDKLRKILEGDEKAIEIENTLKDFYDVAKKIYDNKK